MASFRLCRKNVRRHKPKALHARAFLRLAHKAVGQQHLGRAAQFASALDGGEGLVQRVGLLQLGRFKHREKSMAGSSLKEDEHVAASSCLDGKLLPDSFCRLLLAAPRAQVCGKAVNGLVSAVWLNRRAALAARGGRGNVRVAGDGAGA
eukprot:2829872-Pleurochrysis_carterae.AAC.1